MKELGQVSSDDGKPSLIDHFRSCDVFQARFKRHEDISEEERISSSVRHLCPQACYLTAFAPVREWHYLRKAIVECTDDPPDCLLKQWRCTLLLTTSKRSCAKVGFVSPDGDLLTSKVAVLRKLGVFHGDAAFGNRVGIDLKARRCGRKRKLDFMNDNRTSEAKLSHESSVPDTGNGTVDSPFGLLEELFHDNAWRLLLSTVLLNRTTRLQVDTVLHEFLTKWHTPESVVATPANEISVVVRPLGMCHRRASGLIRFSKDYLELAQRKNDTTSWTRQDVRSLFYCGDYACDAYQIFVQKNIQTLATDHALQDYIEYIRGALASVKTWCKVYHPDDSQHLS